MRTCFALSWVLLLSTEFVKWWVLCTPFAEGGFAGVGDAGAGWRLDLDIETTPSASPTRSWGEPCRMEPILPPRVQKQTQIRTHWNLKNPFIDSCFNWMTRNRYIGIVCFTKNPFLTGCLGFQVHSK